MYLKAIEHIIGELTKKGNTEEIQEAIAKLSDLKNNLICEGSNGGNWLSRVRNIINYKNTMGLWYPYRTAERYFDHIAKKIDQWTTDPDSIDLSIYSDKPILRFLSTCMFITTLYTSVAKEMELRCLKGISFQTNGVLTFLNLMKSR